MQEFLRTVAQHYAEKAKAETEGTGLPASMPLSRLLFCFPNRRCGLFFSKYLHEAFGGACFVPSITTINELFGLFSQRQVPDRTSLLFRLYTLYRQLSQRQDKEEFDQFVFWGDMLLGDFDDLDKYLVDADVLFRNVKDLKDIETEFAGFDPEIVEVIQSFWRNYKPAGCPDDAKREAFGQTWSILSKLYHAYREDLAKDNLAYEGMLEREVVEQMLANAPEPGQSMLPLPNIDKVVFVGLTAISKVDRKLMMKLRANDMAEFCWDYADPRLHRQGSKATSAAYFTAQNLDDFPNEIPDEVLTAGLVPESERQYQLYAVPSAVGQTQLANQVLRSWSKDIAMNPLRTAVVLPDEKLLLPMLYAVPHELGTFNVTMGYPLKDTPIAAFVELLGNLHETMRDREGADVSFYYKPVLALLSHNFVRTLAGEEAHRLIDEITRRNLYQVHQDLFQGSELLKLMFRPVRNAMQTLEYLLDILAYLMQQAQSEIEQQAQEEAEPTLELTLEELDEEEAQLMHALPRFTITDHEFLYHYNRTLEKLHDEVQRQSFGFTPSTLFLLLQKLVAGVSVPFSGEPLQGIQVMGVLETRGMDFDQLVILSMNEGVFPAKPVSNTFIPMSLRNAFDMPTQKHRDAVFAYHFYRMISRARKVTMIYDSRTDGLQTGEESRYVKQLRYLMGQEELKPVALRNDIGIKESHPFQMIKTQEVMDRMNCYQAGGRRNLSATALNDYIQCPLRFYLAYVEKLREDDEVSEGVDNRFFGDILHHALRNLYEKSEGQRIEADLLRQYIDNPKGEVTRQIQRSFEEVMGIREPEGYNLLVSNILVKYAIETLRHDMKRCPFIYLKGEYEHKMLYDAGEGLKVRVKCIYDRLERSVIGPDTLSIIDYKTGSSSHGGKRTIREVADLFNPEGKASHEAFQVMFYCLMLQQADARTLREIRLNKLPEHLAPHLFFVRDFKRDGNNPTLLNTGKDGKGSFLEIQDFMPDSQAMKAELDRLLHEIFDPKVPFTQCKDVRQCMYCKFSTICKR